MMPKYPLTKACVFIFFATNLLGPPLPYAQSPTNVTKLEKLRNFLSVIRDTTDPEIRKQFGPPEGGQTFDDGRYILRYDGFYFRIGTDGAVEALNVESYASAKNPFIADLIRQAQLGKDRSDIFEYFGDPVDKDDPNQTYDYYLEGLFITFSCYSFYDYKCKGVHFFYRDN